MVSSGKLRRNKQYYKFCVYGFLKNLQFYEAFLILFLMEKGLSFTAIGTLYAVREISTNILEVPSGLAADVLGRKKTLAVSFLSYISSFLIFYFYTSYSFFLLAFFFYGAGEALRSGTHKGMIADYLTSRGMKNQMVDYYGHTRSWSQMGLALSSLIAGFIVFYTGRYDQIFLFSTFPFLADFLLILSYPKELDRSPGKSSRRARLKGVLKESFNVLKSGRILKLLNNSALHTAYLKAMKDYIQPMMVSLILFLPLFAGRGGEDRSALLIGFLYFLIFILTSLASKNSYRLEKSGIKNIPFLTLLCGLTAGLLSGFFYSIHIPSLAVFFFILIYVNENMRKPVLTGAISAAVDNAVLTSILSLQSQLKTLMTAFIAFLFGVIADHGGIALALISISAGFLLLTLLLNAFSDPERS
ncbi:MAG: hypothetical protein B6241_13385 [Spirochaetaceae bacterium 4572_59]|nr:MAG: hypothetical protein B6241_13385 [Spirochaetaceae bacterium 4572_59]